MRHPVLFATLAVVLPTPTFAQSEPLPVPLEGVYCTPILSGADDNGRTYGTWATGVDYKVSFHDGTAFYPVLGDRYPHNLPWRWRTTSVRIGEHELCDPAAAGEHVASAWRYEYRFERFCESYDVLRDGIEQRFTISERVDGEGDLVVRGLVTSELRAGERGFAHAPLAFTHRDGTAIVRYGAPTAIDARGRRQPMTAAFDGREIALRLDADWLATAQFPLTVDPLIGNLLVQSDASNRPLGRPRIARDDNGNRMMITFARQNATNDWDAFAVLTDDAFGSQATVWNDVTSSWSTPNLDVAYVGGALRWIIVLQRDFSGTTGSWMRYHTRAAADMALSSAYSTLAGANNNALTLPQVGGTAAGSTGTSALVVYQSDAALTNTPNSAVIARLVNVVGNTAGPAITLSPGATLDRETPSVNQESAGGAASWIVCHTELDSSVADDDWDAVVTRVDATGAVRGSGVLAHQDIALHAFWPAVAGSGERYLLSWATGINVPGTEPNAGGLDVSIERFDWPETAAAPTRFMPRFGGPGGGGCDAWNGDVAFDSATRSHWTATYHTSCGDVFAMRFGFDGGLSELQVPFVAGAAQGSRPAVTFDADAGRFPIVFATNGAGTPLIGDWLTYPVFANPIAYGNACGPAAIGSNADAHAHRPYAGQQFFELQATATPLDAIGAFFIGAAQLGVPIPFLPPCELNVGVLITSAPVNAIGSVARLRLPILGASMGGDFYFQYAYVDPSSPNAIQVSMTQGLKVEIR